ncbi:MAG TPA: hypothetical protein VI112_00520 [Bacteroidia bacterium]
METKKAIWKIRSIILGLVLCTGLVYCTKSSSPYAGSGNESSTVRTASNAIDSITSGNWRITKINEYGKEMIGPYAYITFRFYADGSVKTLDQPDSAKGTWKYYGDQRNNFSLQFQAGTMYSKLNGVYHFSWTNDHIFVLQIISDGTEARSIEFRKLLAI